MVNPTAGLASGNVALSLVAGGATDTAGNVAVAANLASLDSQGINTLAPTVVAVTDNVAAAVTSGPISFTATFSEAVTGVSTSSFTATNGTVASVTQVDSSHYTIVVNPTAGLASGNVALSLVAGGATDTAGNVAVAANLASLDSQGINTLAPTVVAVTDNVAAAVTSGPISFTATFSEAVTGVSTSSFTATNGTVASVTQVDSSHYTIVVNPTAGLASGNVALSLVAGGATDTAGNVAVAANLASLDSQGINTLAPTVVAVTDNVAAAVTSGPISFTATFSEAVTGVSTSSFTATNGTVASVTQVDSSHYTIVVNPTAGLASGNVALSLVAGGATDTAGNVAVAANLASLDSQGINTLAPTVVAVTDNVAAAVTNGPISFTATFSEAVTGVSTSSFTATNGTVASVTQVDSSHYTIVVNPTAGLASGNVALSLVAGGATDTAGNVAVAANLASLDSQGINTLAPTVVAVTDNVAAAVTNGPISFTATFSEAVTGVSTSSFTATNGTVASVTQVDSSHYTIVVNPTAGLASGNVALSLVAGGASDTAGNVAVAANLASLDSQEGMNSAEDDGRCGDRQLASQAR